MDRVLDSPPPRRITARSASILVLIVISALLAGWSLLGDGQADTAVWATIERGGFERRALGTGRFVSTRQRMVTARTPGTVEELIANVGESVDAGAPLVRIGNPELELELESALAERRRLELELAEAMLGARQDTQRQRIKLDQARIELELRQSDREAHGELYADGIVSRLVFERAVATAARSAAELASAETMLDLSEQRVSQLAAGQEESRKLAELRIDAIRRQLAQLDVRAPTAGIVKRVEARLGNTVVPGQGLLVLGPAEPDAARLRFPQRYLDQLSSGMPITLSFVGETIEARIARIHPDTADGTVTVEATARAFPTNARIDMAVRGDVLLDRRRDVLLASLPAPPGAGEPLQWRRSGGELAELDPSEFEIVDGRILFHAGVRAGDQVAKVTSAGANEAGESR